ncbi:MAG: VOC family protein [Gemmatimonadota bacterium]|nr:VOC family protein [Gemmatimonadota bacterium]
MSRVVHFEIHATDPARAVRFYTQLLGWEFHEWTGGEEYWLITTGPDDQPGINGGLLRRRGPAPADGQPVNAHVCTVDVASVDDVVARVSGAGGAVAVAKMPIPGVGWLAYLKDTEGNLVGVMQADPAAG